ncbi:MAG: hypothetical protein HKL82_03685 [Acidimicrobiaceae bacterium]|nr:hypothetical protein [Acidimicrobiaceae bacterium]
MLPEEKRMELFELYDLTKSFTRTAYLCGVDPTTVRRAVVERDADFMLSNKKSRAVVAGLHVAEITEWVELSSEKVRADVSLHKLLERCRSGCKFQRSDSRTHEEDSSRAPCSRGQCPAQRSCRALCGSIWNDEVDLAVFDDLLSWSSLLRVGMQTCLYVSGEAPEPSAGAGGGQWADVT